MRQAILLSACLLLPGTLAAQAQQPLVGSWAVTVPAGMRMEHGVATPMQATGALTVRVEGDSLIGTLKMEPFEDAPDRPADRLTAKFAAGAVVFISRSVANNGQGETATLVSTYSLEATGDTLKGTLTRALEGYVTAAGDRPQPISGKRVK
jgi:hypothetical protein